MLSMLVNQVFSRSSYVDSIVWIGFFFFLSISFADYLGSFGILISCSVTVFLILTASFQIKRSSLSFLEVISFAAIAICLTRLMAGGLVAFLHDSPALTWNVDSRYFNTLSWTISKFGDLSRSLEYAGGTAHYHAGPAWIAGSVSRFFDVAPNFVLFIGTPIISLFFFTAGTIAFLNNFGVNRNVALFSVALILNLPEEPLMFISSIYGLLVKGQIHWYSLDHSWWFFGPTLMLNSLFALAFLMVSLAILSNRRIGSFRYLAAIGLVALIEIKPQAMIAAFFIAAPMVLIDIFQSVRMKERFPYGDILILGSCLALAILCFRPDSANGFVGIDFDAYRFFESDVPFARLNYVYLIILVTITMPLCCRWIPADLPRPSALLLLSSFFGLSLLLYLFIATTTFAVTDPLVVERANDLGLTIGPFSISANFNQAFFPMTIFGLLMVCSAGFLFVQNLGMVTFSRLGFCKSKIFRTSNWAASVLLILASAVVSPISFIPLAEPRGELAYEWADEDMLYQLMWTKRPFDRRIILSDLSDQAENHKRAFRALSVTAVSPAEFYLSNLAYGGFLRPDSLERLRSVRRFFGTEWSLWHTRFLISSDIGYVLIRQRCEPAWLSALPKGLVVSYSNSEWSLLKVTDMRNDEVTHSEPSRNDLGEDDYAMVPKFGYSPCLSYPE